MSSPRALKVAHYLPWFYPWLGGIQHYVRDLVTFLDEFEFEIVTNRLPGTTTWERLNARTSIRRFGPIDRRPVSGTSPRMRKIATVANGVKELYRKWHKQAYLKEHPPDVIHLHRLEELDFQRIAGALHLHFLRRMALRLLEFDGTDRPVLYTDHSRFAQMLPSDVYSAHILRNVTGVICVEREGQTRAQRLVKELGLSTRVWYIPNWVDTSLFRPGTRREGPLRIGYVARLGREGTDVMIRIANRLPETLEFWIAGAGSAATVAEYSFLTERRGVKCFFNLPAGEIPAFYQGVDLLVNPLPLEGVGKVTLEAMASGVPVLMFAKGDRYPVIAGETGFVIPDSPRALDGFLGRFARDPENLERMGKNARDVVVREFDARLVIPQIASIYREVGEAR